NTTAQNVIVLVNGDTKTEPDETFQVTLSSPVGAMIGSGQETATGAISNDDPIPGPAPSIFSWSDVHEGLAAPLTVTGRNFVPGSVVQWNGVAVSTTYQSATQLQAVIPDAKEGNDAIMSVVNPGTPQLTSGVVGAGVFPLPVSLTLAPPA